VLIFVQLQRLLVVLGVALTLWATQLLTQRLQLARHVSYSKPCRDFEAQTLPRAVVNRVEYPKFPPTHQGVRHEIQRPTLIETAARQHRTTSPWDTLAMPFFVAGAAAPRGTSDTRASDSPARPSIAAS